MKTIETTMIVRPDGGASLHLPPDIPPGEHRIVLLIDAFPPPTPPAAAPLADFPQHDFGPWPADFSLRREDLYDDDGR